MNAQSGSAGLLLLVAPKCGAQSSGAMEPAGLLLSSQTAAAREVLAEDEGPPRWAEQCSSCKLSLFFFFLNH